jgi:integrase
MTARRMKGSWWVDFRFKGDRIRRKSPIDTKRGAEEHERKMRQQLLDGTFEKIKEEEEIKETQKKEAIKVSEFAKEFIATYARSNNKPSEVESKEMIFKNHIVPFFGTFALEEINSRSVERYKAKKLDEKLMAKTINNQLTVLHKMLSVAQEWQLISNLPPIKWLRTPEVEFSFLDFEEAERLKQGADGEWKAMITVALKTGLRLGELLALRWEDVDLVAGNMVVRRAASRGIIGTPKNGKWREIPLSVEARRELKAHRHLRGELIFCDQNGKLIPKTTCKWPLWRACKRAGLRRIGWHALRHTFASHLAMRGVSLKAIQELLGHATIEMTMRYAHLTPAIHREAVAQLDLPADFGHLMGTDVEMERRAGAK